MQESQAAPSALVSNENPWNDWNTESKPMDRSNKHSSSEDPTKIDRLFEFFGKVVPDESEQSWSNNDWDEPSSPLELPAEESKPSSIEDLIRQLETKVEEIVNGHSNLFPQPTRNLWEILDRFVDRFHQQDNEQKTKQEDASMSISTQDTESQTDFDS